MGEPDMESRYFSDIVFTRWRWVIATIRGMSLNVWKCVFIILTVFGIIQLLPFYWKTAKPAQSSNLSESLQTFNHEHSSCAHLGKSLSPEEQQEERKLLNSITWPYPPPGSASLDLSHTSDPAHSLFTVVPSENNQPWYVGDQLEVQVHLRDFNGRPKRYGGDFLLARLHSPKYRAGVAGQVSDHENGLYSVRFTLLWQGSAQVEVMMVHSSEAVAVLRRLREERPDRVFFVSSFRRGRRSEETVCNMCLPPDKGPLCNYTDLHYGEPWYCYKPKGLGCDTRYDHRTGGFAKNVITEKEALLFQSGKNVKVPIHASTTDSINVLPSTEERSLQKLDPVKLATSGYYYQDLWRPLGGVPMRHFDDASAITQCLTNKSLYMYGDSTVRQWYEYLVSVLPGLKNIALEKPKKQGPITAVDVTHNILLNYHFHGLPIRIQAVLTGELRYIANQLDSLPGGPNTVVTLGIWAHFGTFPVGVYIQRIRHIRKAVVRLLERAPGTMVVVRTANPQALERDVSLQKSDWLMLQQDIVLRAMFKGINVMWVDAWQMCLAHREPHDLHPPRPIVKTMVDMMLSYICRDASMKNASFLSNE